MYFDRRLWQLTRGARWRIAAAVAIGLLASAIGIARFAFLGWLLALVFTGAKLSAVVLPAVLTAGAGLLRGWLGHARTMIPHPPPSKIQELLRGRPFDKVTALRSPRFSRER